MTPDLSFELEGEREKKMLEDHKWDDKKKTTKKEECIRNEGR